MAAKKSYSGYKGSRRATIMLLFHLGLLFWGGTFLYLYRWHSPFWLSALLVLLWVPVNFVQMCLELRDPALEVHQRKAIWRAMAIVAVLCVPYAGPGQLFSYWVSDTGFRLLYGNHLQANVVSFLQSKSSYSMPSAYPEWAQIGPDRSLDPVKYSALPAGIRANLIGRPIRVFINGSTPKDRHLRFWYTSAVRPQVELLVGGPDFVPNLERYEERSRQMWPGVYCVDVGQW